jgi:molybdenum cofactor cytidylyltransferase
MPETIGGLLVALADMPAIATRDYDRLIDAFREAGGNAIIRATVNGKRGNPVILPRSLFEAVSRLEGDMGARYLVEGGAAEVVDVELGPAAGADVDTPDAMMAAGGSLRG